MSSLRAVLVLGALLSTAQFAEAIPMMYLGHEYDVIASEAISWENARDTALTGGSHLATVGDTAENAFIESLLSLTLQDRSHYWIGGTDAVVENVWQWVDSTPFGFTDWWGGEPNDVGNEDFLAYDLRRNNLGLNEWAWNDASNGAANAGFIRGYVTERAVSAVPEPGSLLLLGTGAAGLIAKARRRKTER